MYRCMIYACISACEFLCTQVHVHCMYIYRHMYLPVFCTTKLQCSFDWCNQWNLSLWNTCMSLLVARQWIIAMWNTLCLHVHVWYFVVLRGRNDTCENKLLLEYNTLLNGQIHVDSRHIDLCYEHRACEIFTRVHVYTGICTPLYFAPLS